MRYAVAILIGVSFGMSEGAHANEFNGVLENNRGVRRFMDKKPVEAFDRFMGALADLPYSPDIHFNLGTAFLANQEYSKAISEYTESIRNAQGPSNADRAARFRAYFNMAAAFAAQKQIDEALATYQLALNENPESVETKTNIELLTASNQGDGKGDKDQQDSQDKDQKKDSKDQKDGKDQKKDQQKDQNKDKDKDKDKDQKDQQKDPKDKQQKPEEKPKPTPRPFKSDQLNSKEVGTILDELKRQEEQIRARMQNDKAKDGPVGKDW